MLIFFEMKKVLFALTLLVTLIFAPGGVVLAAEKVNPGDDYKYVIKRLKEKVVLFFFSASPNKKINFYKNLIDIRLAELKYVVERKDIANFQTVSQRYTATNGEATDLVLEKGTKVYIVSSNAGIRKPGINTKRLSTRLKTLVDENRGSINLVDINSWKMKIKKDL